MSPDQMTVSIEITTPGEKYRITLAKIEMAAPTGMTLDEAQCWLVGAAKVWLGTPGNTPA